MEVAPRYKLLTLMTLLKLLTLLTWFTLLAWSTRLGNRLYGIMGLLWKKSDGIEWIPL